MLADNSTPYPYIYLTVPCDNVSRLFLNGTAGDTKLHTQHTSLVLVAPSHAVMAHHHIIGGSGYGKSTLAQRIAIEAILRGEALVYIDPHGDDTNTILNYIPPKRRSDVVLFDPTQFTIPWNPLINADETTAQAFANGIKYAWGFGDVPTARMYAVLLFTLRACIARETSLMGLYYFLTDTEYRDNILSRDQDPTTLEYWRYFERMQDREQRDELSSTLNKVRVLFADPRVRALSQPRGTLDIPSLVQDKILLVRLSQGELGLEQVKTLGSILLTQIHQTSLKRDTSIPLTIVIDECQEFAPDSLVAMLAGIRKFNVSLVCIHHYLDQLAPKLMSSLKGNAIANVFRVSVEDSRFFPPLPPNDLQLWEQSVFTYTRYDQGKPQRLTVEPAPFKQYKASAEKIRAYMRSHYQRKV